MVARLGVVEGAKRGRGALHLAAPEALFGVVAAGLAHLVLQRIDLAEQGAITSPTVFRVGADYADKARAVSELTRDLSELLPDLVPRLLPKLKGIKTQRLAFHPPCTLQHGQQLRGGIEIHLGALGFDVKVAASESHLCCGSAGTYSVLQPELSKQLRDRKLANLAPLDAQAIVSANIGCIQHLQTGTPTPVMHCVEVLDEALA